LKESPNYFAIIPANVRYDKDLRANEKLLYGEITALAKKTGECWASNKYFSELYEVQPNAVATWIRHLKEKNYIEIEYEYLGKEIQKRIIKIGGIQKDTTSYPNEYGGGIQKDSRGGIQKGEENNTSNIKNTSNNIKEIYKESFEKIWEMYPNKKGKNNAYKSFEKAVKEGVTLDEIATGLQNYVAYIEAERIEPRYIKNGSTWFNQRCWEDDYTIRRKPTTKDLAGKMDFTDFLNEGRKR
jgi:hypothetical protein